MKNTPKYLDLIRSCGYEKFEFSPVRLNHIAEFYEWSDMFLKVSPYNKNTKGFLQEFLMMKYLHEKELGILPRPISYNNMNGTEIICMQKIHGELLSAKNYNSYVASNIKKALQKMYNVKSVHGDVKVDNVIVTGNNEICLIDFDQSYRLDEISDFETSPDMVGNDGRNLTNLIRSFEK